MLHSQRDTYEKILRFVEKEIEKVKTSSTEKNTPRQITNGGKLVAYNKVRSKIKSALNP